MNLIKCEKEHYYDADKFDSCPHCANATAVNIPDIEGKKQHSIDTAIPSEPDLQTYKKIGECRAAGWLVCIEGSMKGDSFTLYEGANHIGRASHMDVILFKEATVSRENHAVITYNSKARTFRLESEHTDSVLYNRQGYTGPQTLKPYDRIQLGDCILSFIPFCGEHFAWK